MDPQNIQLVINLAQGILLLIFLLVSVNLYLVFRLKDIDPFAKWNPNHINGILFLVFMIGGFIAATVSTGMWIDTFIFFSGSASEHGNDIDRMMVNTTLVTILVILVTNGLLFYFSYRYRGVGDRKALYYPHNNRLELIWTLVPAVVMALLVFDGARVWYDVMLTETPEDAVHIELNGKQFEWTIRYPGADLAFGDAKVQYINEADANTLGFNFEDKNGHDDLVVAELHLPVGETVALTIRSRDVLHSATLPHFRVKMDAVPGMPTHFKFKPTKTTVEMRKETGNPEFNFEMSCQQICGNAHYNMRRVVIVETRAEYDAWLAKQKPFYATWKSLQTPDAAEASPEAPAELSATAEEAISMNE